MVKESPNKQATIATNTTTPDIGSSSAKSQSIKSNIFSNPPSKAQIKIPLT